MKKKKNDFFDPIHYRKIDVGRNIYDYRYNIKRRKSKQEFEPNLSPANIAEIVRKSIINDKYKNAKSVFITLQGYEKTKVFEQLTTQEQTYLLTKFDYLTSAEILEQSDSDDAAKYIGQLPSPLAASILKIMSSDDVVSILDILTIDQRNEILSNFEPEEKNRYLDALSKYTSDEAGKIMADGAIIVSENLSVDLARDLLVDQAASAETINVLFAINSDQKLVGIVDLRSLILSKKEYLISEIMETRFTYATEYMDQEEAVNLMKDYDLTVMPVVDSDMKLLGVITADDAFDVFEEEAIEDFEKFAALSKTDTLDDDYHLLPSLRKRVPWLVAMALLSVAVTFFISSKEKELQAAAYLVPFITLINNMTGISAVQASAITMIRVNSNEFNEDKTLLKKFLKNQTLVILVTAIIVATLDAFLATIITVSAGNIEFANRVFIVVFSSVLIASAINSILGVLSVLLLKKLKKDPISASGPIMQTVGDLIAVVTYLSILSIIINK
jgi:magnesium transporter